MAVAAELTDANCHIADGCCFFAALQSSQLLYQFLISLFILSTVFIPKTYTFRDWYNLVVISPISWEAMAWVLLGISLGTEVWVSIFMLDVKSLTNKKPTKSVCCSIYLKLQCLLFGNVLCRGGMGREFCRVPDPGTRPLLLGRIRVVARSGYFIFDM